MASSIISPSPAGRKLLDEAHAKRKVYVDAQSRALAFAKLNSATRAAALWDSETQPLISGVTATTSAVLNAATEASASPEMLRAGLGLFNARLEWLRLSRLVAVMLSATTVEEIEREHKLIESQSRPCPPGAGQERRAARDVRHRHWRHARRLR